MQLCDLFITLSRLLKNNYDLLRSSFSDLWHHVVTCFFINDYINDFNTVGPRPAYDLPAICIALLGTFASVDTEI